MTSFLWFVPNLRFKSKPFHTRFLYPFLPEIRTFYSWQKCAGHEAISTLFLLIWGDFALPFVMIKPIPIYYPPPLLKYFTFLNDTSVLVLPYGILLERSIHFSMFTKYLRGNNGIRMIPTIRIWTTAPSQSPVLISMYPGLASSSGSTFPDNYPVVFTAFVCITVGVSLLRILTEFQIICWKCLLN